MARTSRRKEALAAKAAGKDSSKTDAEEVTTDVATLSIADDATVAASTTTAASTAAITIAPGDEHLFEALPGEEHHAALMRDAMSKLNVTTSTYADKIHPNARDIKVGNLTVILAGRVLLEDTELNLHYGQRYALVGPNGSGKSILLTMLGRRMVPLPANLDVYHVSSEVAPTEMTAVEAVMAVDTERNELQAQTEHLEAQLTGEDTPEQEAINDRLCEIYERLDELNADNAEARAASILFGLGFTHETMQKKCREFSGGWRMRISLARALFVNPTCLLLDGPTAHLDMEAVVWLENYLKTMKKILLMVSHSQDFMNNVCTDIIRLHQRKLEEYGGNYDTYMATRAELEEHQMKRYQKQQEDIADIKDFVARFGHGTRKMAQQAQSREKLLAKMLERGVVEKVQKDVTIKMQFPDPGKLPPPVLQLQNVSFGYPGRELLYENVDFGVDLDSRIALLGPNGKGKTTLLKLMTGELHPTTGGVRPHPHLRIARYTQHFVDGLDLTATPLEFFCQLLKDDPVEEVRKKLGRFGVTGEMQSTKMSYLSDGIKARIIFAQMALRSPHLLLLDEPTNSLDIEMIDSLAKAINSFQGGVVLVSHDMRLISQVVREIYEVNDGKITKLSGDILEYKAKLASTIEKAAAQFEQDHKARAATGKTI